jgi:hypothetical protein
LQVHGFLKPKTLKTLDTQNLQKNPYLTVAAALPCVLQAQAAVAAAASAVAAQRARAGGCPGGQGCTLFLYAPYNTTCAE